MCKETLEHCAYAALLCVLFKNRFDSVGLMRFSSISDRELRNSEGFSRKEGKFFQSMA
jgi:hypothetical protein